jgi:hypothetical protein
LLQFSRLTDDGGHFCAAEDLLRRMLRFDPAQRISAVEALAHPFFRDPSPELALHDPTAAAGGAGPATSGAASAGGAAGLGLISPPPRRAHYGDGMGEFGGGSGGAGSGNRRFSSGGRGGGHLGPSAGAEAAVLCVWDAWRAVEAEQRSVACRLAAPPTLHEPAAAAARREAAVGWILKSATKFCKCDRTVHLAVAILDRVEKLRAPASEALAIADGSGTWTELLGIAALLLACKFQEVEIHQVEEFVYFSSPAGLPGRYDANEVLDAEIRLP